MSLSEPKSPQKETAIKKFITKIDGLNFLEKS